MKKIFITLFLISLLLNVNAQSVEKKLAPFSKILIGPGINVELIHSDEGKINLVSDSDKLNEIVVEVVNDVLKVYFSYSKFNLNDDEPFANSKYSLAGTPYEGVKVYARLYYTSLEGIDFRGEGKLFCKDVLESNNFSLKIYGDNDVKLSKLNADHLNAAFYGENHIDIQKGRVLDFKIKAFGENSIMANGLKADEIRLTSMGESDVNVHAESSFKVKVIGEGDIRYSGDPRIKEFNLGEARIYKVD